jgi:hypothetical protein
MTRSVGILTHAWHFSTSNSFKFSLIIEIQQFNNKYKTINCLLFALTVTFHKKILIYFHFAVTSFFISS